MKEDQPVEYRYGPGLRSYLAAFLLLLAAESGLLSMGWFALPKGPLAMLTIFAPIARFLFWIGIPGLILTGMGVVFTARFQMRLVLTEHSLICPRLNRLGLTRETIEIPYTEIVRLTGSVRIRIELADGRSLIFAPGMMESGAACAEFRQRLEEQLKRSREKSAG